MTDINEKTNQDTRREESSSEGDREDAAKSPERLEREVDQARARLGSTVSELSDRLSPGELIDQALGMAREHGGEFGRNLGAQVKDNPIPMILAGVGISWMMMSSGHPARAQPDKATATGKNADGGGFMDSLGDTAAKSRDKAARMGDRMHAASDSARDSAHTARESLVNFYRDQPLLAGSVGIAVGAALGSLIPPTEVEDDMLGAARDRSVGAAKSEAAHQYEELRESARSD